MRIIQKFQKSVSSGGSTSGNFTPEIEGFNVITGIFLKNDQDVAITITEIGSKRVIFEGDSKQMQSPFFPIVWPYEGGKTFTVGITELAGGGAVNAVVGFQLAYSQEVRQKYLSNRGS